MTGIGASPLYLVVQVSQAFNNLTSLVITLESDSVCQPCKCANSACIQDHCPCSA